MIVCVCCRQFKAAIANVWVLHNQKVTEVSLFSTQVIPDIMKRRKDMDTEDLSEESHLQDVEPLLYIGEFVQHAESTDLVLGWDTFG